MKVGEVDTTSAEFWDLPVFVLGVVVCIIALVFWRTGKPSSEPSNGGFVFFLFAVGGALYVLFMLYTFFQAGS